MHDFLTAHDLTTKSFEEIEALQNIRFRAVVHHLLPKTKFYSDFFKKYRVDFKKINRVEDWQKYGLPLIKKSVYMKNARDFIVKPDLKSHLKYLASLSQLSNLAGVFSSIIKNKIKEDLMHYYFPKMILFSAGTESGMPTPVTLTAMQKQKILPEIAKIIHEITPKLDKKISMNLFPYGPHLAWHSTHIGFEKEADLNLCTAAGGAMPTENLVKLANETKPNIFAGMSSYLRQRFLPECQKQKIKLPEKVIFLNGAEKMVDAERKKIYDLAKKLGVKKCIVLDFFGASEFKEDILPECEPRSGFHHIAPMSNIIKTVEFNKSDKNYIHDWDFADQGYAVNWNIDGGGTLLHGYVLGDKFTGISRKRCPNCHLNVVRIKSIDRIRDVEAQLKLYGFVEAKVKGTRMNLSAIRESLLKSDEIKEAQIIAEKNKLTIFIVPEKGRAGLQKVKQILKGLEVTPVIKQTTLDKLKQGKVKFEGIILEEK